MGFVQQLQTIIYLDSDHNHQRLVLPVLSGIMPVRPISSELEFIKTVDRMVLGEIEWPSLSLLAVKAKVNPDDSDIEEMPGFEDIRPDAAGFRCFEYMKDRAYTRDIYQIPAIFYDTIPLGQFEETVRRRGHRGFAYILKSQDLKKLEAQVNAYLYGRLANPGH
jgi:hypothetical protein